MITTTEQIARAHRMPFSAEIQSNGQCRFALWAPAVAQVQLELDGSRQLLPMHRDDTGWHSLTTRAAAAGTRYSFHAGLPQAVPDPASRFQPEDVHDPSEVIDPQAFSWEDQHWQGRPWDQVVLYELHVGTFTEEGTFLAAIGKLDHLAALGVTAIELMPIADFPGKRNWGYDGVLLYAPDSTYGRPEHLKQLVQAAHQRGLAVLLDVVYNHFGPDGNYLPAYAPQTFTERHKTPWGNAINYDGEGSRTVRDFVLHNALYWLQEFHFDGLRMDAVHEIKDDSRKHLLDELAERVRNQDWDRPIHLLLENEKNEAHRLRRGPAGKPLSYTAQWNDDMHHVLHTAATLETHGYYGDYAEDTEKLGRALAEGFAFQGELMQCTQEERGEPSGHLPPGAFVAFMQNHDQIGNRAFGERINAIASPEAVHAIAAVYLLLPQTPMLFMGEEWGSSQPFPFFCDFAGDLGEAVRKGRREEFSSFPEFHDPGKRESIPDPQNEQTFLSGKLDWQQARQGEHKLWIDWYTRILRVRRERITPLLPCIIGDAGSYRVLGDGAILVQWQIEDGRLLTLAANLSDNAVDGFPALTGSELWHEGPAQVESLMRPWSTHWSIRA